MAISIPALWEFVYPPLVYVKPIRKKPMLLKIGNTMYQIVEVKIMIS